MTSFHRCTVLSLSYPESSLGPSPPVFAVDGHAAGFPAWALWSEDPGVPKFSVLDLRPPKGRPGPVLYTYFFFQSISGLPLDTKMSCNPYPGTPRP